MRFQLSDEQSAFAETLDSILGAADTPRAARDWAAGEHARGLAIWRSLAEFGLPALLVPEAHGGLGATPLDLVVALRRLGYHAVPGPYVDSVAVAPHVLEDAAVLTEVAMGEAIVSVAAPPMAPYALDADIATYAYLLSPDRCAPARTVTRLESVSPARRLFTLQQAGDTTGLAPERTALAIDTAVLACSAQLLGTAQRLFDETVSYAKTRRQFGRAIGEFQAIKHALADVKVAIDFTQPLLHGAALSYGSDEYDRDVSAAKASANATAHRAFRVALQVHGAIGYTEEYDLSIWLTMARALLGAWGTGSVHRDRVLAGLGKA